MSTQSVSDESIVVLNDNFQYDSSKQEENAKWVDLANVMSVKRDKTIYAVRARNSYDFSKGRNNTQFFANTLTAYQLKSFNGDYDLGKTFTSNIYRGFDTDLSADRKQPVNILLTAPACVYGNLSNKISANLNQLGIGGSLNEKNFKYGTHGVINVQSNVSIFGNIRDAAQLSTLDIADTSAFFVNAVGNVIEKKTAEGSKYANVDANTAYMKVFYNDDTRTQWNRLINATIAGNILVTASVDPCDNEGNAVKLVAGTTAGDVKTNEAYRHQFQLKKNNNTLASQNPMYIARVSRFGQSLSDNKDNQIASKISLHSFTGNMFAMIPSDNSIYAGANVITGLNITGNIALPDLVVFNSNFASGNLYSAGAVSGNFNANRCDNLSGDANNARFLKIEKWADGTSVDYISGTVGVYDDGSLNPAGQFKDGDRFTFVQANVHLDQGYMLLDRISFNTDDSSFVKASKIFSANTTFNWSKDDYSTNNFDSLTVSQNYNKLWFQSNIWNSLSNHEVSAKYIVVKGVSILANNWQSTSLITPSSISIPRISNNPNLAYYTPGNIVNLYLRRAKIDVDNYTYIDNKSVTTTPYVNIVPSFVGSFTIPSGNLTLTKDILETGTDTLTTYANTQQNLPRLASNATVSIAANVSCNYMVVVSGNTNVEDRIVKRSNVVCPDNFGNSFIANCWNYGTDSATLALSSQITNNVSIIYGPTPFALPNGEQVRNLRLDDEMAKKNITYNLEFVRATGGTNASSTLTNSNFIFYANLNSQGVAPNVNLQNWNANTDTSKSLNDNQHIQDMHLNNVAFSEYTFSGQSYKFTDVGGVLGNIQKGTNYNYQYILPVAITNTNSDLVKKALVNSSDSYINVIADYLNFNNNNNGVNNADWNEITAYDFKYRYGVDKVIISNGSNFNNEMLLNGNTFTPASLYSNASVTPALSGNLEAAAVSCYVYENIDDSSILTPDSLYPFVVPKSDDSLPTNAGVNNLFPGFVWKNTGSGQYEYFQNKNSTQVDLMLPANSNISQDVQLIIHSQDIYAGTIKVGLSTGLAKCIPIKPIAHGYGSDNTTRYATPIVCGVSGEANTYVVVMIECKSSLATDGLTQDIADFLPARVNINIIEKKDNKHQLTFKGALRVFNTSNVMNTNVVDNFNFKTPLSNLNYSSSHSGAEQTASLAVNVFSVPANGAIISFIYEQHVVSKVLSYSRVDSVLNGSNSGYTKLTSTSISPNFAWSKINTNYVSVSDSHRPAINANSTRYYLDSQNSGIFIDISNNATLSANQMGTLRVDRSVEWVLTRTIEGDVPKIAGRGLMSKNSFDSTLSKQNYYIYENLVLNGSGYLHVINTNLNNLCTRCVLQSLQTDKKIVNGIENKNNWSINTQGDRINLQLVRMNPVTGLLFNNGNPDSNIIKQMELKEKLSVSGTEVDLGYLLGGSDSKYNNSFINFTLVPIRGFGYNSKASLGSLDVAQSMFSIKVQPDNYALVAKTSVIAGTQITGSNVLFSKENKVKTYYNDDFSLSFEDASLAYQYLNVNSPSLSTSQFVQIGEFKHNGLGKIQYFIKDFTSNYNNPLTTSTIPATAGNLPLFGDSTHPSWQVNNVLPTESPTKEVLIRYDEFAAGNKGKYYFNMDEDVYPTNPTDRIYFRGTGIGSLPYSLNNNTTLLLYTGLRPVVINVLDVLSGRLEDVITGASKFKWTPNVPNSTTDNIFQSLSTNDAIFVLPNTNNLRNQSYQVVLTNKSAADSNKSIYFRASKYTFSSLFFNNYSADLAPNRIFLGAYMDASKLFNTLRLTVKRQSNINTTFKVLTSEMISPLEDPQKSDDKIIQGAYDNIKYTESAGARLINSGSASFRVSDVDNGPLFTISINGALSEYKAGDGEGFQVNILPSKMTIYTAMDINNNGEIDVSRSTNVDHQINGKASTFGLQTMFSELNFKLPYGSSQYMKPNIVSSWSLDRAFHSVPGAPFDIKLNNMWAVGYNLDCFFTIQNNAAAQFDVITINTKATTNPDGTSVSALEADATTAPLFISHANEWARSLMNGDGVQDLTGADNYGTRSGLTFKLKNGTTNVIAGDVVRLYVDNTIAQNTLEWRVSVANKAAKTYQLYSYDQERYAALLDEQMAIANKFTNEA